MTYKICLRCCKKKDLSEYTPHKRSHLGVLPRCKPCQAELAREYRRVNKEKVRQYDREFKRKEYQADPDKFRKRKKEEYWSDPDKFRKRNIEFYSKNRELYYNQARLRGKRVKRATPQWLTSEQKKAILAMYALRDKLEKISPVRLNVDHIVPLKGRNVCGLHVPWNLQLLEEGLNKSKSNKPEETNFDV